MDPASLQWDALAADLESVAKGGPQTCRPADDYVLLIRHADRGDTTGMDRNERDAVPATDPGLATAREIWAEGPDNRLPFPGIVAGWGVRRTLQTAEAIVEGVEIATSGVRPVLAWLPGMASRGTVIEWRGGRPGVEYEFYKQRYGWDAIVERWLSPGGTHGPLPPTVLTPTEEIAPHLFKDWLAAVDMGHGMSQTAHRLSLIVASDFHILTALKELRGLRGELVQVPFLGGVLLRTEEMRSYMEQHAGPPPRPPSHMRLTRKEEGACNSKSMVIGLGTGRCGTQTFAELLQLQPPGVLPSHGIHEDSVRPWLTTETRRPLLWALVTHLKAVASQDAAIAASVHPAWIHQVESILDRWPGTKFVVVERDRDAVVESFMRVTGDTCYWLEHDGESVFIKDEPFDHIFPTFHLEALGVPGVSSMDSLAGSPPALQAAVKRRAAGMYVDWYHTACRRLLNRFGPETIRMAPLKRLGSDEAFQKDLLRWIGVPEGAVVTRVPLRVDKLAEAIICRTSRSTAEP